MITGRRQFLRAAGAAAVALAGRAAGLSAQSPATPQTSGAAKSASPAQPTASEFVFARLRYDSGDWDYNPKVASNVLNSIVEYTEIPVYKDEVVIAADSDELAAYPFLFMTGHKLVRFSEKARANLVRYVEAGGFLFSDDCNHDVNGLYAKSFEEEMRRAFPGDAGTMPKLANTHAIYRSFFRFPAGPPQTSHELNGWGDDIVHEYLRGVERHGRVGVLYSNKDYGCEWDYDWRNKHFLREDNTKFAVNLVVYAMT